MGGGIYVSFFFSKFKTCWFAVEQKENFKTKSSKSYRDYELRRTSGSLKVSN